MAKFLKRYNTQEEYDQDLPNLNKEWMIGYVKEGKKVNYLNNPYYGAVVLKYRFTEDFTGENAFFNSIPETESVLINGVSYDPGEISSKSWSAGEYEVKFYSISNSETINFLNCEGNERLVEVYIDDSCGITEINASFFRYCSSLREIVIPDTVTNIGEGAFARCSSLASINIPKSVTIVGKSAFANCSNLTSITISENVTNIGDSVFYKCTKLTSITIPKNVKNIGNNAFYYCSSLTSINIPENSQLMNIGGYAFSYCSNLTSITIPESVTSIGNNVFSGCSKLTSIICFAITAPTIDYGTFGGLASMGVLKYPQGSDYSSWMLTDKYYLGYYNWTSQEI